MSESDRATVLPSRQVRVVKMGSAVFALVLVVVIVAVGELFILRAASRADARRLACYVVRYSSDTDQTAKEIRAAYRCPPPRALPSRAPAVRRSSAAVPSTTAAPSPISQHGPAGRSNPAAPGARSSRPTLAGRQRSAPGSPARSGAPSPVASPSGILGGLLCDPAGLTVCLK